MKTYSYLLFSSPLPIFISLIVFNLVVDNIGLLCRIAVENCDNLFVIVAGIGDAEVIF